MRAGDANERYQRTDNSGQEAERLFDAVYEDYALFFVDFREADFDDFSGTGLDAAADVLGFDGHFTVAAIDEHAERDTLGAAKIEEAVHGGADGAAGVENVVHKDQIHAVDAKCNVGRLQDGLGSDIGEVVAIKSDVERADGDINAVNAAHGVGDALGQRHTAAADANESEAFGATAFLHDLVGQALQGPVDFGRGH